MLIIFVFCMFFIFFSLRSARLYLTRSTYTTPFIEKLSLILLKLVKGEKAANLRQEQLQDPKRIRLVVLWNAIIGIVVLLLIVIATIVWIVT